MKTSKKSTYIIVATMFIALSITAYFVFKKPKDLLPKNATKQQMCEFLISSGATSGPIAKLLTFGDAFIAAWYAAAVAKQEKFMYQQGNYWVKGGTKVITR